MYSLSAIVICILSLVVAAGAAYAIAKWAFSKDTEIEGRRRAFAKLAGKLRAYGLQRIPNFLESYAVGDYSGMAKEVKQFVDLFLDSEDAVMKEFDAVYDRVLAEKLKTEEGRTLLAAKLHDAVADTDSNVVHTAPSAEVSA